LNPRILVELKKLIGDCTGMMDDVVEIMVVFKSVPIADQYVLNIPA